MNKAAVIVSLDDVAGEARWIQEEHVRLGETDVRKLVAAAQKVRDYAYPPYSNYHVGAAVWCTSGKIYAGCNTEVVSWSQSSHAEQNAITNAICDGEVKRSERKFIMAVAVVHESTSAPCGHCRQIIAEHCDNCLIVLANEKGKIHTLTSLRAILPLAFTPSDLGK